MKKSKFLEIESEEQIWDDVKKRGEISTDFDGNFYSCIYFWNGSRI